MATFIEEVAPIVQRLAPNYDIRCCSAVIAQAILESGWGKSSLAAKYHNYFGIKCGTAWTGESVNLATKEEYTAETLTDIRDNFRVYPSMEEGIKGYFELLGLPRYQNLKGITEPKAYLETIKADGYTTSSSYVSECMLIITQNNLTQYDTGETMPSINKFVERMRYWCDTANLGYDQSNRWDIRDGGECDCSSLVIHCLQEAGFDTGSASYTGDMSANLTKRGWKRIPNNGNPQVGDILLNDANHVAVCTAPNMMSYAASDENGRITGGQAGDQTGKETRTTAYANYSKGWDCYLRYSGASSQEPTVKGIDVDGKWGSDTTRALQSVLGLTQDGIIAAQRPAYFNAVNKGGLLSNSWQTGSQSFSQTIQALQVKIGYSSRDGQFGTYTCKALQKYLGVAQDGIIGNHSETVKELQRRLNNGTF